MRKTYILFLSLTAFFFLSSNIFAQNVEVSNGGPVTSYATLGLAVTAINTGLFTGTITVNIVGNTTEAGAVTLDSSGNGTGSSYTSITIQPSGGAARTISGAVVGHLFTFNGADNVTINGLNTGSNSLAIRNSGIGASSTIRFFADATNNTVTNCTLTGSTTSFGVVYFATGANTGNDGNTVSNNNITVEGVNFPTAGVYSLGTSTAIDNSGNIISGNNISDYFSASAVTNGMNLTTGTSGWTISNNRFFQSANRTYTTANTHNGIVASVGSGYTITGNTIGYATSGGTGTYTMLGTIATRFVGINLAVGTTAATSSVQGNTITAISMNTSSGATTTNGIICGINVTSGNVNIGNVTPNVIGTSSGVNSIVGIPTTTGGLVVGINSSSTGTILIQGNAIGGLSSSGTTAAIAGSITGINVSGVAASMTITGNTVGNGTTDNMRGGTTGLTTGSPLVTGIALVSTPSGTTNVTNNTIQNLTAYGTGATAFARGITTAAATGSASIINMTGNTIYNIATNSTLVTFSNAATTAQGIMYSVSSNGVVSGNTIYNISCTNTGTGGYTVSGIGLGNATSTKIEKNIIYGLTNASTSTTTTAPGVCAGILVRSATTSDTVINNMITLGAGQTTNTSFIGIMCNNGSTPDPTSNIFYNTISISGTVTTGAQPSFAFARTDFSVTAKTAPVVLFNNVFDNSRSGGTGKHYAIANNYGATATATGWSGTASNYNVLNSASASTVGYWTADQTLAQWRTSSAGDLNSLTAIPIIYTNTATGNLRFNMGVTATQLESGATPISTVTTDIDGFARPKPAPVNGGGFAPDFGASEADMVPLDLSGPSISYTIIGNTPSTSNRTLTSFAAITDPSGVNVTAGTKPRIYYKKSTDANAFVGNTSGDNGWKWSEATNGATPFSFVIDNSIILGGTVSAADVIQYFVVAQDLQPTPNVSSNPSSGFTGTTVAAITSAPTTPNSYTVTAASLSGSYTVGTTLFNLVTGNNITFEERTRRVMREVPVQTDESNLAPSSEKVNKGLRNTTPKSDENLSIVSTGKTQMMEVEEKYSVAVENGSDYKGALYHEFTREEKTKLGLSNDMPGVYATITAAVNDMNLRGVAGATTFLLTDASYAGETLPITVNFTSVNKPTASNTVTIKPNTGVTSTVTGSINSSAMFKVINTNYVTIDGSNSGTTSRDLTWTNTSVTSPSVIHFGSSGTTPITNGTLKNCIIINGAQTATAVVISDAALGTAGYFNNMTIQNNSIQKAFIGSYNIVVPSSGNGSGLVITGNDLNTSGANAIRLVGIYVQGIDGATVSNNNIGNLEGATLEVDRGIWLATSTVNTTVSGNTISALNCTNSGAAGPVGITVTSASASANITVTGNNISNLTSTGTSSAVSGILVGGNGILASCTIEKNIITNIKNTNVSGYGCNGIQLSSTSASSNISVVNNSISDVAGVGFNGSSVDDNGYGMILITGGGYKIYNNSVNLNTNQTVDGLCSALNITATAGSSLDIRNNIFSNAETFGTNRYAIYCSAANTIFSNINYNDYYTTGPNLGFIGVARATMTDIITGFGGNTSSVSGNPGFTAGNNLVIDATSPNAWTVNGNGTQIASVSTDILGASRSTTVSGGGTDIGAYNVTPSSTPPNATEGGTRANSSTSTYTVNGRQLCSIAWGAGGTVPTGIAFTYYPGVNPPGSGGFQVGNGYWIITATGGSGFTYDVTFNYDDALLGTISPETDLRLSKSEDGGGTWTSFLTPDDGSHAAGMYALNTTNNTILVYGLTGFSTFGTSDADVPLPVELSSFTSSIDKRNVTLKWSTITEQNNSGFDIERKVIGSGNTWSKVGNVAGAGTSTTAKNYNFTENNLNSGKYNYRLKQIDFNGNFKYYDLSNEVIVGVPSKFDISQNYPNPFNPSTKINFDLPFDSKVQIKIYDMTGKEMAQIVNESRAAGYYTVQFNASMLSSGIYFYQINATGGSQSFVKTMKMVLVK